MVSGLLEGLNAAQQQAAQVVNGPVLVLAGPGSGKTRVLTYRIAYLVQEVGIDPYSILGVTFTNKAAREMKARLESLMSVEQTKALTLGTFHSLCTRFLRRDIIHLERERDFAIYDSDDQQRLMRRIVKELGLDEKKNAPRGILSNISKAKNEMQTPQGYINALSRPSRYEEVVALCYARYHELMRENNALDFDDLLSETVRLFDQHPDVLESYHRRYVYLLVDEYQDTNRPQYEIVRHLAAKHRNLFVIGDDDQSIYAWRGADVRNILEFERDYPDAQVFTLEQNYRSTQNILDIAQAVIHPGTHNKKHLWTERGDGVTALLWEGYTPEDEAQLVADELKRLLAEGYRAGDCAVMYRTNAQSRVLEEALLLRNLPYQVVGGIRFYERKEIKDVLSYLRFLHNPADSVSLLRIINTPTRGIGEKTLEQLNRYATEYSISMYRVLELLATNTTAGADSADASSDEAVLLPRFSTRIQKALLGFYHLIEELRSNKEQMEIGDLIDSVVARIALYDALVDEYGREEADERWNNVQELRAVAEEYAWMPEESQLVTFLEEVALVADTDKLDSQSDAITCITLHQAKGLEYPIVFLIGLEEGLLPHSRCLNERDRDLVRESMEEERRLFYVGITRARERLYLLRAFRRYTYGSVEFSDPSRFLSHIPTQLLSTQVKPTTGDSASRQREMFSPRSSYGTSSSRSSQNDTHTAPAKDTSRHTTPSSAKREKRIPSSQTQGKKPSAASTRARITSATSKQLAGKKYTKPEKQKAARFVPGQRVRHHIYGEGVVLNSMLIAEGDEEVVVNFLSQGEKRLLASFAKLEAIED